jgi:hypothetical protein
VAAAEDLTDQLVTLAALAAVLRLALQQVVLVL